MTHHAKISEAELRLCMFLSLLNSGFAHVNSDLDTRARAQIMGLTSTLRNLGVLTNIEWGEEGNDRTTD